MANRRVLLVNPNRMLPPIAPIGLDYVASGLERHGYKPSLCDLTFAEDWRAALKDALAESRFAAVGVSIRNIDDCYFASQDFVLKTTSEMIAEIRNHTERPIILGGIGFSAAPIEVLEYTGADYGIMGEGEIAFPQLLDCLRSGGGVAGVPGAVYRRDDGQIAIVPPAPCDPAELPVPQRLLPDNDRYFMEGGQIGVETLRGCSSKCIYCMEPWARGKKLRTRLPESVAEEFRILADLGVDAIHLCDSEFNLSKRHAHAVCDALIQSGVAGRVRWYTYAAIKPFDLKLAKHMAQAGCAGIDFGADHVDEGILRSLGRAYGAEEIRKTVKACQDAGITVMCDMLFGGPGETRDTLARAVEFMKDVGPDRVGLSCGVRLYKNTPLGKTVRAQGPLDANPHLHGQIANNESFLRPVYYLDDALGLELHPYVSSLVGDDKRFLHTDPTQLDGNYNYNDNSVLVNAIRNGARGAYWDILRKLEVGE